MPKQGTLEPLRTEFLGSWVIINIHESQHKISEPTHAHTDRIITYPLKEDQVNVQVFAPVFP